MTTAADIIRNAREVRARLMGTPQAAPERPLGASLVRFVPRPAPKLTAWSTPFLTEIHENDDSRIAVALRRLPEAPSLAEIRRAVADAWRIPVSDLTGIIYHRRISQVCAIGMAIARLLTGRSLSQVAACFGRADHSAVTEALRTYGGGILAEMDRQHRVSRERVKAPRHAEAWSAEDDDAIRRMRAEGHTAAQIGHALGRGEDAIRKRISKIKCGRLEMWKPHSNARWTGEMKSKFRIAWQVGMATPDIADMLNVNPDAIHRQRKRMGLEKRTMESDDGQDSWSEGYQATQAQGTSE